MEKHPTFSLPILPLPKGVVLYPGIFLRIPASAARPDIPALIASIYARASANAGSGNGSVLAISDVPVVCVPMTSPLLDARGRPKSQAPQAPQPEPEFVAGRSTKADLFKFGVVAKITKIEGRDGGEFELIVQGHSRVSIDKIVQEQPHFEGKVTLYPDEANLGDQSLFDLFEQLKAASRDLAQALRVASVLAPDGPLGRFTPLLARRLDGFILNKTLPECGSLADFMMNMVMSSYDEKLQVLALTDVKARMAAVVGLLTRQTNSIRNSVQATTVSIRSNNSDEENNNSNNGGGALVWDPLKQGLPQPKNGSPINILVPHPVMGKGGRMANGPFGRGAGGGGRHGGGFRPPSAQDQQEADELDELQKSLEAADLSPEAAKVAEREMKRLRKVVPAQAEYNVIRSYLETLADIPWSKTTTDRLGPGTLAKARQQLDSDHYGLEKVKKRLLEYLAVLRLKQAANDEVEAQVRAAEQELVEAKAAAAAAAEAVEAAAPAEEGKTDAAATTTTTAGPVTAPTAADKVQAAEEKLQMLHGRRVLDKSPILLLVGPPGVGKTSLARSVAASLGRKFHRISLGGVRDEAEIRGHRRTYVAAMPGLIMQGLRKVGVANPVVLLDEIDKVSTSSFHGDPSAALLEVLDPEQNQAFVDHYVAVPYDLSRVLFVATANSLDTIPAPLLDRMETIHLPGYTTLEKKHIAMQYLVPKQIRVNGLAAEQVGLDETVVAKVIESYTREAGVRNLERELGAVCRAKAVEYAEAKDGGRLDAYRAQLTVDDLERILGSEKFEEEIAETSSRPGIVTGLVAYSSGGNGSILFIEVADMPGRGRVQLTGKLGDVLKESVEVALSWVKAHAFELGLTQDPVEDVLRQRNIHVHCPSGAIPKDGPSSGMAQAIALISLFSGRAVPPTLAMTGEITLRGRITAVGGIKEKLIGALRAGVKTVLLPAQNRKDVRDAPQEVKDALEISYVSHIWEAIRFVWPDAQFPRAQPYPVVESRL